MSGNVISVILLGMLMTLGLDAEPAPMPANASQSKPDPADIGPQLLRPGDVPKCLIAKDGEEFDSYSPRTGPDQCKELRQDGFTYRVAAFVSDHGALPYIYVRKDGTDSKSDEVAMLIVGGPGDWIWGKLGDPFARFLQDLAEEYGEVVVPGYYGTAYRNLWPDPSIERATDEVLAFVEHLEGERGRKVSFIAGSAGGFVLNEIAARRRAPLFLINPVLLSMDEIYRQRRRAGVFPNGVKEVHFISGESGRDFLKKPVIRRMPVEKYYSSYFGKYYRSAIVNPATGSWDVLGDCAAVVVGSRDDKIGLPTALSRWLELRMDVIEGMDHDFLNEDWEREAVLARLRSWKAKQSKQGC